MARTLFTRSAVSVGMAAILLAAGSAPAWAEDPMPGSANDTVMSTGQAILVFVGIPLVVVAVIYLLVSAPGWTRGGRASSADAWTSDPMVLGAGDAAAPAPAIEPAVAVATDESGGTSASW